MARELPMTPDGVSDREHLLALLKAQDERFNQRMNDADKAVAAALAAAEKAVTAALAAAEKAVLKAELAAEDKFRLLNELRGAMKDQASTFATIASVKSLDDAGSAALTSLSSALSERLSAVTSRLDRMDGSSKGLHSGWGYLVGAISLAVAIAAIVLGLRS